MLTPDELRSRLSACLPPAVDCERLAAVLGDLIKGVLFLPGESQPAASAGEKALARKAKEAAMRLHCPGDENPGERIAKAAVDGSGSSIRVVTPDELRDGTKICEVRGFCFVANGFGTDGVRSVIADLVNAGHREGYLRGKAECDGPACNAANRAADVKRMEERFNADLAATTAEIRRLNDRLAEADKTRAVMAKELADAQNYVRRMHAARESRSVNHAAELDRTRRAAVEAAHEEWLTAFRKCGLPLPNDAHRGSVETIAAALRELSGKVRERTLKSSPSSPAYIKGFSECDDAVRRVLARNGVTLERVPIADAILGAITDAKRAAPGWSNVTADGEAFRRAFKMLGHPLDETQPLQDAVLAVLRTVDQRARGRIDVRDATSAGRVDVGKLFRDGFVEAGYPLPAEPTLIADAVRGAIERARAAGEMSERFAAANRQRQDLAAQAVTIDNARQMGADEAKKRCMAAADGVRRLFGHNTPSERVAAEVLKAVRSA